MQTKSGLIDADAVAKFKTQHDEAEAEKKKMHDEKATATGVADATAEGTPEGEGLIHCISSNQTQEYFTIATDRGFEIIQNDSGSAKLKKKVQLCKAVSLVEMMYKTNIIVLVFE